VDTGIEDEAQPLAVSVNAPFPRRAESARQEALLEDDNFQAALRQQSSRGQPADACSHHGNIRTRIRWVGAIKRRRWPCRSTAADLTVRPVLLG
jgi:hypothetical protein